ncbi:MAG: cytochrome P450, partial [Gemmatimonadetes bacterium]|nr:cytochrome P450 [Gemmatimonadota bacterium]
MINPALASQLDALRAQASPSSIPGGLLAWWGKPDFPTGAGRAPVLSQPEWEGRYAALQGAALDSGIVTQLLAISAMTKSLRPDGPLPIAIADFGVCVPRPEFARQVGAAARAGRALDPAPVNLAAVIREQPVFMAAGLLHDQWGCELPAYRGRAVTFLLDERFYFRGPQSPLPDRIEIDPGDGGGFRAVAFGETLPAKYEGLDCATVAVRCAFGRQARRARFRVPLSSQPAAPAPDETWTLETTTQAGESVGGSAFVYRAPGHQEVVHPVIMAEGFPGGYPYDYLYDLLNQAGTLEALRATGYDVIILGFRQGWDRIQKNAQVAIACLQEAMRRTAAPLVAGGVSMGGLVMRYALAEMETRGLPHHARVFLTIDTPHRGAYTSVGTQWFAHTFRSISPQLDVLAMLLDLPANQQFLTSWVHNGTAQVSPLREAFLADLSAVGSYPQQPRRLAMSCGRGDGQRTIPPRQVALTWTRALFASAKVWTLPEGNPGQGRVAEGDCYPSGASSPGALAVTSDISWEGAPGGQNTYNLVAAECVRSLGCGAVRVRIPRTCSVPTVSALDLEQSPFAPVPRPGRGTSPFHDYHCLSQNEPHLTINAEARDWLLERLGKPDSASREVTPMTKPFDPNAFDPHDPKFIEDPYPTYASFREQAPVHLVKPYGSYWVFRYADVVSVLSDQERFRKTGPKASPPPPPFDILAYMPPGLFSADPPRHDEMRAILDGLFPVAIRDAADIVKEEAGQLLAAIKELQCVELISAFAQPLPSTVLLRVLGIPEQDRSGLIQWVTMIAAGHDITQPVSLQALAGSLTMSLIAYYQAYLRGCPHASQDRRLVDLMAGIGIEQGLTADEVQMTAMNMTVAGYISTTFVIGTGTLNLFRNPEQLTLLRARPELLRPAVEEMLRYDAPAQLVDREVAVDTTLSDTKIKAGDKVTAVVGSANRDLSVFNEPDRFLITREKNPHLTFGDGIHYCIGAPLARTVTPIAIRMLFEELCDLRLAGLPQWQTDPYLR